MDVPEETDGVIEDLLDALQDRVGRSTVTSHV